LTYFRIKDNWGTFNINIPYEGLSWKQIIKLNPKPYYKRFIGALLKYYYSLKKELYKEPDAEYRYFEKYEDDSDKICNYLLVDKIQTFNEVWDEVYLTRKEYEEAVARYREALPFHYYIKYKLGYVYPNTELLIKRIEAKYLDRPIIKLIKYITEYVDRYQNDLIQKEHNYWEVYRIYERNLKMHFKYQLRFREQIVSIVSKPSYSKVDEAKHNLDVSKEQYIKVVNEENYNWDTEFTEYGGTYPFRYCLYQLPDRPIRPSIEEIENKIKALYPELPERPLTEEEQYEYNRWNKIIYYDNLEKKLQEEYEANSCGDIPKNPHYCDYLMSSADKAFNNVYNLVRKARYPNPIEDFIEPIKEYEPLPPQYLDWYNLNWFMNKCFKNYSPYNKICIPMWRLYKKYALTYCGDSLQERENAEVLAAQADMEIASLSLAPERYELREKYKKLKDTYIQKYGTKPKLVPPP